MGRANCVMAQILLNVEAKLGIFYHNNERLCYKTRLFLILKNKQNKKRYTKQ